MPYSPLLSPMLALMVLTLLVWIYMYIRRLTYIFGNHLEAQSLSTPEAISAALPESVNRPSNNLKNLFELPVIFYALCLLLMQLNLEDALFVGLAWTYVAVRALHSVVHCTVNWVLLRFYIYALSSVVLWVMLLRLVALIF